MSIANRFLALLILSLFALVIALGSMAFAHDHSRPELTPWFKQLKSGKGLCCDGTDALHLSDVDWKNEGGRYKVKIPKSGEDMARAVAGETVETIWVDVPIEAVITEPNLAGSALVWPIYGYMGASIRCFMPGALI